MEVRVQKWGNSLAVRLPKPVAIDAKLEEGSVIDVRVVEGKLVAEPVGPRYALEDLLRCIKKGNLHGEIETGPPVGREVW
jgi:antitoxin MazE